MDRKLQNSINKMKLLFEYDTSKTLTENKTTDKILDRFINDQINESELTKLLSMEFNLLNEGSVVKRMSDWVWGKLEYMYGIAITAGKKVFSIVKSIINVITKFKEKYPTVFKVIVILLIILVIIVATSSTAHAAATGNPPNTHVINAAIGLIQDVIDQGQTGVGKIDFMEAQTYLQDLKQGGLNPSEFSEQAINIGETAISKVYEVAEKGDSSDLEWLSDMARQGGKLVSSTIQKITFKGGSWESVGSQVWSK